MRIRDWHECIRVLEKVVEFDFEFGKFGRVLISEVVLFAGVFCKVVKFRCLFAMKHDEFPISIANGRRRSTALVSPMRIMPEKRCSSVFCVRVLEEVHEAYAILVLFWKKRHPTGFQPSDFLPDS